MIDKAKHPKLYAFNTTICTSWADSFAMRELCERLDQTPKDVVSDEDKLMLYRRLARLRLGLNV